MLERVDQAFAHSNSEGKPWYGSPLFSMKNRKGAGYVSPADLAVLQFHFDALITKHHLDRSSGMADIIAAALMSAHASGISDQADLMRLAEIAGGFQK